MLEHHVDLELMQIMNRVKQKVALDFEGSYGQKEVPTIESTLTKDLYFHDVPCKQATGGPMQASFGQFGLRLARSKPTQAHRGFARVLPAPVVSLRACFGQPTIAGSPHKNTLGAQRYKSAWSLN